MLGAIMKVRSACGGEKREKESVSRKEILSARREIDRLPAAFGNVENFFAVGEGARHLRTELIGSRGQLATASGADELHLVGGQLDIFRSGYHELLGALRAIHDGVKEFLAGREADRTVWAFESKWHALLSPKLAW
jgi:hypothetical protein